MTVYSFPSLRTDGQTLILGLGETGLASALWCAQHGAALRVVDTRAAPGGLAALQAELDPTKVNYRLGPDALTPDALVDVHTIVISPGLSPEQQPVQGFLQQALAAGIEVIGEIELFARALADMADAGYRPQLAAITGTNGKTTVTAMLRQLIQASGRTATAAGNISPAALSALRLALQDQQLPDVWVVELSSFQLMTTFSLKPDAAVVLNLTQDHLDWHGSFQAYAAAKARLLEMADVAVVNRDDAAVLAMVAGLESTQVRSFGQDQPYFEGDLGLDSSQDMVWLLAAEAVDFDVPEAPRKRAKSLELATRQAGRRSRLMPADVLRVRGRHNVLNALAALTLGRVLHLGWASMLPAMRDYAGEAHRTEFVRSIAGVDFVNDSKGTNVGATVAALQGAEQPVVLIAGGLAKGQDFSSLALAVHAHARAVVLIGQDAAVLATALENGQIPVLRATTLGNAVEQAFAQACPGDMVLLSPACASMDMFDSYVHRGVCFVDEVQELALNRGEVA
ncbi:UDP-N-acetylmuramoyl-L-alanine--D-glutamate ligase [Alcaligenaceae bacterium]|nr:UDP-N-acetylmuramoyl-L-alanine--D-glutamate ligase [Alcaligenaceae bacterium]